MSMMFDMMPADVMMSINVLRILVVTSWRHTDDIFADV